MNQKVSLTALCLIAVNLPNTFAQEGFLATTIYQTPGNTTQCSGTPMQIAIVPSNGCSVAPTCSKANTAFRNGQQNVYAECSDNISALVQKFGSEPYVSTYIYTDKACKTLFLGAIQIANGACVYNNNGNSSLSAKVLSDGAIQVTEYTDPDCKTQKQTQFPAVASKDQNCVATSGGSILIAANKPLPITSGEQALLSTVRSMTILTAVFAAFVLI
jgi:hypothetical protein